MKISRVEFERIRNLKIVDFQQCSFCRKITILNLGWPAFRKLYCRLHEKEYVLCWDFCYKVCLNIWGCQLYQEVPKIKPPKRPVKPNKTYDLANCYLCFKELKGASKKGVIKNRNNPAFWGIGSSYKILCLNCLGKKFFRKMEKGKQRTFNKYVRRGYI